MTISGINLENEISAINKQHNTAIALLEVRKKALIDRVTSLVTKHQYSIDVLKTTLTLTENSGYHEGDDSIQNIANDEYQKYKQAVQSTRFWDRERNAVNAFQVAHDKLLECVATKDLSEKTKVAVLELIQYIDQHIEPGLWNTLFRKTSWNMLLTVLNETCSFIETKSALDRTDPEKLNNYITYLNDVDGKPHTGDFMYPEFLLPIMPLIPGITVGFDIGFFSGGVLCPALGLAIGLALSLALLYFIVQNRLHTGLSKKMLNVADAEREFAGNQLRDNLNPIYNEKRTELMEENRSDELITNVIQSIDDMYGSNDPAKSLVLLELVKEMLTAKTQSELKRVTHDLIQSSQTNTYSSLVFSLFKSQKNQLKEDIQSLVDHLKILIQRRDDELIAEVNDCYCRVSIIRDAQ